jgi:5-amino-6-(5-phosphoribosylamino)uracil reductase
MQFQQLVPESTAVELGELLSSLTLAAAAPPDRPYTIVNFISSVDGRATFHGRSGPLGDDGDKEMFHGLREQVDAVMAGIGTLRTERYGRILNKPERRERRVARGLSPEPIACIVTRSGDIPTDIPMLQEPEQRVVIFAPESFQRPVASAQLDVVALDPAELTLTSALRRLRSDFGVESLLCEGGPTMFGALLTEAIADELFLTLAPKLAGGGTGPTITAGAELPDAAELELRWLLERNRSLFLRYSVRR